MAMDDIAKEKWGFYPICCDSIHNSLLVRRKAAYVEKHI